MTCGSVANTYLVFARDRPDGCVPRLDYDIEGSNGNISCLHNMRRASTNPQLHFHEVRGADHFGILAPVTAVVAEKIRQDTGPSCNIQFTDEEIRSRF